MNFNLKELTIDNIGQWPKVIKIVVILVLAFLIMITGYFLLIKPNVDQLNDLSLKEAELKTEFEKLQRQAVNLSAYRKQMVMMEERFGNMLKKLPTQNEMPGLLEDISKTGIASGLKFELFAPSPEILHDFYIEVPIQIIVIGRYQELAVFLSRIAEMNRIVTLHDFVIEGKEKDLKDNQQGVKNEPKDTTVQNEQLIMKITATIYRYRAK